MSLQQKIDEINDLLIRSVDCRKTADKMEDKVRDLSKSLTLEKTYITSDGGSIVTKISNHWSRRKAISNDPVPRRQEQK